MSSRSAGRNDILKLVLKYEQNLGRYCKKEIFKFTTIYILLTTRPPNADSSTFGWDYNNICTDQMNYLYWYQGDGAIQGEGDLKI